MNHRLAKLVFNLWPPFLGAGVKVRRISPDWKEVDVQLRLGLTNRNYVGVHFGGSLYSMTDPFYMLMLLKNLGKDYIVWDKAGSIDYLKPGRGVVCARFRIDDDMLQRFRDATAGGDKHLPALHVSVYDAEGAEVARINKTLYIRRKPPRSSRQATS
jgi:acyl-coenzyme A thioesterase PaaI-like protein